MYYHDQQKNTYTPIRTLPQSRPHNDLLNEISATSFNIYYLPRPGPKNEAIHAFPSGLRVQCLHDIPMNRG